MVSIENDVAVDLLCPGESIERLAALLGLLCGQEINLDNLSPEAKFAIEGFLRRVRDQGENNIRVSYEEFNELLLLFNQDRVERPFFDFFFLDKDPRPQHAPTGDEKVFIDFSHLKNGVKRFRLFAMLCFGNFRFAFRELSEEKSPAQFMRCLDPWNRDAKKEKEKLVKRQEPLTPLTGTQDEIEKDKIWLLGYLSADILKADHKALKEADEALKGTTQKGVRKVQERLNRASNKLDKYLADQENARKKGKRNSIKYLTWDYLDIYVATSMRQPWEFEETYNFVKKVFTKELQDIQKIRWFDPTQSYYENVIDKGLLEGLMLKRAKCTIYMAQEGDTLGKDSELAATLAQGKPVIAYVPEIKGNDLVRYAEELKNRPLRYFRQRLLTLLADGFFDKPDNRSKVSELVEMLGLMVSSEELKSEVDKLLKVFDKFEYTPPFRIRFQLIGEEEEDFRKKREDTIERAAKLLTAIESRAADNRADTIKNTHPLGMQVHLENGVANGVLVARTEKHCASLVRGVLTRDLKFDIEHLSDPRTKKVIATVLLEKETQSRFRVVTKDECLTNSFWNFYLENEEPMWDNKNKKGGRR